MCLFQFKSLNFSKVFFFNSKIHRPEKTFYVLCILFQRLPAAAPHMAHFSFFHSSLFLDDFIPKNVPTNHVGPILPLHPALSHALLFTKARALKNYSTYALFNVSALRVCYTVCVLLLFCSSGIGEGINNQLRLRLATLCQGGCSLSFDLWVPSTRLHYFMYSCTGPYTNLATPLLLHFF